MRKQIALQANCFPQPMMRMLERTEVINSGDLVLVSHVCCLAPEILFNAFVLEKCYSYLPHVLYYVFSKQTL